MDGGGEGGGGCCDLQERAAWWWSLLDVAETRSSRGSDAREMLAGLSERSRTKSAPTPSLNSERASLKRQRHNVSLDSFWNTRWLGKSELQLVFILLFFFLLAVHDVLSCFVFCFFLYFLFLYLSPRVFWWADCGSEVVSLCGGCHDARRNTFARRRRLCSLTRQYSASPRSRSL